MTDKRERDELVRKFESFLNEDDEAEYEVVSSTKQRLDFLNEKVLGDNNDDDDDDNNVIVVSTKPKIGLKKASSNVSDHLNYILAVTVIVISLLLTKRRIKRATDIKKTNTNIQQGSSQYRSIQAGKPTKNACAIDISKKKQAINIHSEKDENPKPRKIQRVGIQNIDVADLIDEDSTTIQRSTNVKSSIATDKVVLETSVTASTSYGKYLTTTKVDDSILDKTVANENTIFQYKKRTRTETSLLQTSRKSVIECAAEQMVQDIKLVEEVLQKNGIHDYKNIAPSLAVSLQANQQLIDSQREMESRRLYIDAHHKHLDRQLSQRQHEESLNAAKFDPNWKEKLKNSRDECWTAVHRLAIEAGIIYQVTGIIQSVLDRFYDYSDEGVFSIQSAAELIVSNLCRCRGESKGSISGHYTTLLNSSTLSSLFSGVDAFLHFGTCYAHCIISTLATAFVTMLTHQGLRVFSAPSILHHVVNALAFISIFVDNEGQYFVDAIDKRFVGLLLAVISLYAMVQWRYIRCRKSILSASKEHALFQSTLETSLDHMDSLCHLVCGCRYATAGLFCAVLLTSKAIR